MKQTKYIAFSFMIFILGMLSIQAKTPEFEVSSKSAVLYQLKENKIVYEKNKDERLEPASLTKIMTAIVALEKIDNLDKTIVMTSPMFQGLKEENASVAGFYMGEKVTYRDLLYGVLFPSGADATQALAIELMGSKRAFVDAMNQKASALGMKQTHFENETGLPDDNHYSSASDIAILFRYALKNKDFYEIITTREYTTKDAKQKWIPSYQKIANRYQIKGIDYILGGKTGFTNAAGYCLATIANYDNTDYLLVTLGSSKQNGAVMDAKNLYDYYFENYGYVTVLKKGESIFKLENLKYTNTKELEWIADEDIQVYLEKGIDSSKIKKVFKEEKPLAYGMKKNTKLGVVSIQYEDEELAKKDIILKEDVSFQLLVFVQYHLLWILLLVIVLFFIYVRIHRNRRKSKKKKKRL